MKEQRLKTAANQAVSYRNYRRARDRALARLARAYPNLYKEYLEQEKASDEYEGRKWVDISGRTNTPRGRKTLARKTGPKPRRKASNNRKNTRNSGRKK
jgi:hypothetical protein